MNTTDKNYEDAIKVWLLRNSYDLKRVTQRNHQKLRGLTEREIVQNIKDVTFGANASWRYSDMTPGEEECPVISFKYKTREYRCEVDGLSVFKLIKECCEIMDEADSPVVFPELE